MRYAPIALALVALLVAANPSLAVNEGTTLPLHVVIPLFPACADAGDPCAPGGQIQLDTGTAPFPNVFLLARNFEALRGVQTAFAWPGYGLLGQTWLCQGNQLAARVPQGPSGGPGEGTIATVFDNVLGPDTAVIGFMTFQGGTTGDCIVQVESSFDNGTHVLSDLLIVTPVPAGNRGSVCNGPGGVNACEGAVPVEPSTWGSIKGQYR